MNKMPKLKIGHLTVPFPIIQGGMGVGISMAGLATAVSNNGGIGTIASVGLNTDLHDPYGDSSNNLSFLREEIRKAKSIIKGPFGINIMRALTDFYDQLRVAVEEKVDMVMVGAGLLLDVPREILNARSDSGPVLFLPIVSSAKAAKVIFKFWERKNGRVPDGIIVEGPLAGGHLGFKKEDLSKDEFKLENLLKGVIEVAKEYSNKTKKNIPVIGAGGIFTGSDIKRILDLGAAGVQMGTRFVATKECDASEEFKKKYVESKRDDLEIIKSPVGLPGRVIKTKFVKDILSGESKPVNCKWKCIHTCDYKTAPFCIGRALINAKFGRLEKGIAFAGANAWRVDEIISVKELFSRLEKEYAVAEENSLQKQQFRD